MFKMETRLFPFRLILRDKNEMFSMNHLSYKVEVGSARYKQGVRWTECMEFKVGKADITHMVIDYILTISMIIISQGNSRAL